MVIGAFSHKFRRLALGLVPALALIGTTPVPAQASVPAAPNTYQQVTEYAINSASAAAAFDIITGPDGNIWFTVPGTDQVIAVNPADGTVVHNYLVGTGSSCQPTGITIGPDHLLWVACFKGASVMRINPSTGAKKSYPLPSTALTIQFGCSCPIFLTSGPDGYLWFTENGPGYITKLNVTTGALHRYALPAGINADPRGITVGSDGKLWFTEAFINRIGRMTTSGVLTTFAVPTGSATPWGIAPGPDGALYYTELDGNKIGRITTSGVSTDFPIPTSDSGPRMINVGPDGNLWFAEYNTNKIGSMTPNGSFAEVAVPTATTNPFGVAIGPDGNVWFTERNALNIGKLGARSSALNLDQTAIGFNVDAGATSYMQTANLTNTGADAVPAFTPTVSGSGFALTGSPILENCSAAPIAAAGSCYANVAFSRSTPGTATGRLDFVTDPGTAKQQKLSVGLSATINAPSCSSVAISTSVTSPQNVGQSVGLTGTSVCPNASPFYRFYLRSPAGVWSIVQDFSTSDTFPWNTTTYKPGTYLTGVWVRDAQSTKTYDAYAFGTFTLQFPNCTSTNMTGDASSPGVVGDTITFTASALGCPNPLFQWWVRNPAAVWSIAVPYASGTTFAWDTTTLEAGTWQIGVWAKQVGSSKSYDAFAFLTFQLSTSPVSGPLSNQPCFAVNVDAAPPSPQDKGTTVTLTAAPLLCDAPLYKFWIRDTSGVWAVVQDYSTTSSYVWSTASRPAGTYLVGVWVKQTGDFAQYEAYSFITYTLTVPAASQPCSSVGITPDVASPQAPGATVTFTGAALGCGTPTYKFFVAPPGGAFAQVQPYGPGTTYVWSTAGLAPGPYQVGVWARNAGSTKSYEAFAFITFQLTGIAPCRVVMLAPTAHGWTTNNILSQSPQPAGITVNWSATATCDGTPQYAFYVQKPGSAAYAVLRSYGPSGIAVWNTAGLPRGNYNVKVLVRNTGSTSPYEVFAISAYELA